MDPITKLMFLSIALTALLSFGHGAPNPSDNTIEDLDKHLDLTDHKVADLEKKVKELEEEIDLLNGVKPTICNGTCKCGNILHADPVGGPDGWTLCYIDSADEAYRFHKCNWLLEGLNSGSRVFSNEATLLAAGGNYGCWHGKTGKQQGASGASNNVVERACRDGIQHHAYFDIHAWNAESTTMGVCIRYPHNVH